MSVSVCLLIISKTMKLRYKLILMNILIERLINRSKNLCSQDQVQLYNISLSDFYGIHCCKKIVQKGGAISAISNSSYSNICGGVISKKSMNLVIFTFVKE